MNTGRTLGNQKQGLLKSGREKGRVGQRAIAAVITSCGEGGSMSEKKLRAELERKFEATTTQNCKLWGKVDRTFTLVLEGKPIGHSRLF